MRPVWIIALLLGVLPACGGDDTATGSGSGSGPPSPRAPGIDLPGGRVRLTVGQRSDAGIPGSRSRLRVHLDDITRGQVGVTLSATDGTTPLGVCSMRAGNVREFRFEGRRYQLEVVELHNALVGQDRALLEIREVAVASEEQRIEALIAAVEASGLVFLRNGSEYDSADAARHLRRKRKAAGERVRTAEEFIDRVASRSSITGLPYGLKRADGTVVETGDWLSERLVAAGDS